MCGTWPAAQPFRPPPGCAVVCLGPAGAGGSVLPRNRAPSARAPPPFFALRTHPPHGSAEAVAPGSSSCGFQTLTRGGRHARRLKHTLFATSVVCCFLVWWLVYISQLHATTFIQPTNLFTNLTELNVKGDDL